MLRRLRFLLYLSITFLLWLATQLVESYTVTLEVPVKYINLPGKLKLTHELPKSLKINVRGRGQDLILPYMGLYFDTVKVNLSPFVEKAEIDTRKLGEAFSAQFPESFTLISIQPEKVPILFQEKIAKKVPIIPKIKVETDAGFFLTENILVVPDSVTLFGTQKELENFNSWPSQQVTIRQIHESGQINLPLSPSNNIGLGTTEVKAYYEVERFTEIIKVLPVRVKDVPLGQAVRIVPQSIELHFLVPIERYDNYARLRLEAVVDYDQLLEDAEYIVPTIQGLPAEAIGVRTIPAYSRFVKRNVQR